MAEESPKSAVYRVLRQIPAGRVATYGQIAQLAGLGRAARFVGTTLRHLPADSALPWFRVITASGALAFPHDHPSYQRQCDALLDDGVDVRNGKVSLRHYRWEP